MMAQIAQIAHKVRCPTGTDDSFIDRAVFVFNSLSHIHLTKNDVNLGSACLPSFSNPV